MSDLEEFRKKAVILLQENGPFDEDQFFALYQRRFKYRLAHFHLRRDYDKSFAGLMRSFDDIVVFMEDVIVPKHPSKLPPPSSSPPSDLDIIRTYTVQLVQNSNGPVSKKKFFKKYEEMFGTELSEKTLKRRYHCEFKAFAEERLSDILRYYPVYVVEKPLARYIVRLKPPPSSSSNSIKALKKNFTWLLRKIDVPIAETDFFDLYQQIFEEDMMESDLNKLYMDGLAENAFGGVFSVYEDAIIPKDLSKFPSTTQFDSSDHKNSNDIEAIRFNIVHLLRAANGPISREELLNLYGRNFGIDLHEVITVKYRSGLKSFFSSQEYVRDILKYYPKRTIFGKTVAMTEGSESAAASLALLTNENSIEGGGSSLFPPALSQLRNNVVALLQSVDGPITKKEFVALYQEMFGTELTRKYIKDSFEKSFRGLAESVLEDILWYGKDVVVAEDLSSFSSSASSSESDIEILRSNIVELLRNVDGPIKKREFFKKYKKMFGVELSDDNIEEDYELSFKELAKQYLSDILTFYPKCVIKKDLSSFPKLSVAAGGTAPPPCGAAASTPPPSSSPPSPPPPIGSLHDNIRYILNLFSGRAELRTVLDQYQQSFHIVLKPSDHGFQKLGELLDSISDIVEVKSEDRVPILILKS